MEQIVPVDIRQLNCNALLATADFDAHGIGEENAVLKDPR